MVDCSFIRAGRILDIDNTHLRGHQCLLGCDTNLIYNEAKSYDTWHFDSSFILYPARLISRFLKLIGRSFNRRDLKSFLALVSKIYTGLVTFFGYTKYLVWHYSNPLLQKCNDGEL